MVVEGMIALTPCHSALVLVGIGICLTLDAQIHDVVATDGTIIHRHVP